MEKVVERETGLDAGRDNEDVHAEDYGGHDQHDDGSDKSADDNQGSTVLQDTMRRSGG